MVSTKSQIFFILYIKLVSDPCNTWKILIKYNFTFKKNRFSKKGSIIFGQIIHFLQYILFFHAWPIQP